MSTVTNRVFKGIVFTVAMRWANRLIGLVSTLILARLLVPQDFGIVAMGAMVLALASTFLDIGVNVALIRNPQTSEAHYNSAWTLRLMQALAIASALLVASPFAGEYFHDARVAPVLHLMALNVAIGSLENIGIVTFQKEMQFDREFRFQLINRLFSFAITVTLAFALRSYWALVASGTLSAIFGVAHSYVAHAMRPRLSVEKLRELFSVSQWMLLQNIGGYFDSNLHKMLVGRRDDTATMGAYSVASDLAAMPSTELLQPLNRVLFPAFVAIKHDLPQLKRGFLLAQSVQVMVALPAAVFLSLLAVHVVQLLLGPQWGAAVPLLQTLALGYALNAIQISAWYVSITLGKERSCAALSWGQIALFVLLAWVLFPGAHAQDIAVLRVVVSACSTGFQLWIVARALGNVGVLDMLSGVWRTAIALGITVVTMLLIPWPSTGLILPISLKLAYCGLSYVGVLWLLWQFAGRPDGAEHFIGSRIAELRRRIPHR